MTTETFIVDPNNEQTDYQTDYISLNAWEAAEDGVERASGNIVIADCRRSGSSYDTSQLYISGFPAGVIPKVIVHADYRSENAIWSDQRSSDSNYIYIISGYYNNQGAIHIAHIGTCIEGISIDVTNCTNTSSAIYAARTCEIVNTLVRMKNTNNNFGKVAGIYAYAGVASQTITIENVGIWDITTYSRAENLGVYAGSYYSPTITMYNGFIFGTVNTKRGFDCTDASRHKVVNYIVCNAVTNYYGSFTSTSNFNYSTDATGPGDDSLLSQSDPFEDSSTGDFRLAFGSAPINSGVGPSVDANVPQYDIDGTERTGTTCDIGALEYVAAVNLLAIIMKESNQFNGGMI